MGHLLYLCRSWSRSCTAKQLGPLGEKVKEPKEPREPDEIMRTKSVLNLIDDLSGQSDPAKKRYALIKKSVVEIETAMDVSDVSGIPEVQTETRRARIFKPAPNAMQSGTANTHKWALEFEHQERWENPLMGWTSSGDPLSNLRITFASAEAAARHCEKHGWSYFIEEARVRKPLKKSYAANFSWDRRSRTGSK